MTQPPDPNFLCCELPEQADEPQYGTAVTVDVWFMLEYTRPWKAKATEDNELPDSVQTWLHEQMAAVNGRLQFIRQFRPNADTLTFFVGINDLHSPRLYAFHLDNYEALLALDITAVIADDAQYRAHLVTAPHYFVCTNGKRDRSCAIQGALLYRALLQQAGASVWQTTHLGGHRFAATLLSLPNGLCYGRLQAGDIGHLLALNQQDELWLDKLRGHTGYSAVEQVADYFLRQETEQTRLDAFTHRGTIAEANGRWQVQFQAADKKVFQIVLALVEPRSVYASSGQFKLKEIPQYQLLRVRSQIILE